MAPGAAQGEQPRARGGLRPEGDALDQAWAGRDVRSPAHHDGAEGHKLVVYQPCLQQRPIHARPAFDEQRLDAVLGEQDRHQARQVHPLLAQVEDVHTGPPRLEGPRRLRAVARRGDDDVEVGLVEDSGLGWQVAMQGQEDLQRDGSAALGAAQGGKRLGVGRVDELSGPQVVGNDPHGAVTHEDGITARPQQPHEPLIVGVEVADVATRRLAGQVERDPAIARGGEVHEGVRAGRMGRWDAPVAAVDRLKLGLEGRAVGGVVVKERGEGREGGVHGSSINSIV